MGFAIQDKFKAKNIKDMHAGECSARITVNSPTDKLAHGKLAHTEDDNYFMIL